MKWPKITLGPPKWLKYPKLNKSLQNPNLSKIEPKMAKIELEIKPPKWSRYPMWLKYK